MGGQIFLAISVVSAPLLELNQAGKLRILAVTSERRLSAAPDIPTVIEFGMPDLRYAGWFGLFAPRATPGTIVDRIAQATRTAMSDPVLQEAYRSQGLEPDTEFEPGQIPAPDRRRADPSGAGHQRGHAQARLSRPGSYARERRRASEHRRARLRRRAFHWPGRAACVMHITSETTGGGTLSTRGHRRRATVRAEPALCWRGVS